MKDIYKYLDQLGVSFEKIDHPAVFTVEEAEKYDRGDSAHSKNLFLRNKKGDQHYLVVLEASKRVDLKRLETLLEQPKISFASPERMSRYLGLTPGAVSPFGIINDETKAVKVLVDNDLLKYTKQGFHPNVNTATLVIDTADFKKFLASTGNTIIYLDIQ